MLNRKSTDSVPTLLVDGQAIEAVSKAKCLGDVVNDKGNNQSLVSDRAQKGNAVLIYSISICSEATVGKYVIDMMLLMYEAVFLQAVLFNSRAWSNLRKGELEILQVAQLKFLKRTMKVPASASNTGVFLELGILPIKHEINKRQFSFLHHVLNLAPGDPVLTMFHQQQLLPYEINWANAIKSTAELYGIELVEQNVSQMSKKSWMEMVDVKVRQTAFEELIAENTKRSKTNDLQYEKFKEQEYVRKAAPDVVCVIFRYRIRSIKCKANMKSSYPDQKCRLCKVADEDQNHVANCEMVRRDGAIIDTQKLRKTEQEWGLEDPELYELAKRVKQFDELCAEKSTC